MTDEMDVMELARAAVARWEARSTARVSVAALLREWRGEYKATSSEAFWMGGVADALERVEVEPPGVVIARALLATRGAGAGKAIVEALADE